MKITIYELLGMIKDGNAPRKIKYKNKILYFDDEDNEDNANFATFNYYDEEGNSALFAGLIGKHLNDEVEVIEDNKKIKQIYYADLYTQDIHSLNDHINEHFNEVYNKIYEIIRKLNGVENEK